MKRILTALLTLFAAAGALQASDEIRFAVTEISNDGLTAEAASSLRDRVVRALSRVDAVSDNPYEVFDVVPSVELHDKQSTEGLVREVARITGDLTLRAVNRIDGTLYHSVTLPLSASATGGLNAAMQKLPQSVKPTDPVFVRFIRQARNKIDDYYAANCATIIAQAQLLADTGRAEEAASYLSGVTAHVPCYDAAAAIITEISRPAAALDTIVVEREVEVERVVEVEVPADTVVVERVVEVEVPVEVPVAAPAPAPAPQPQASPSPRVVVHADDLKVRILSCRGNLSTGRISIRVEILNLNPNKDRGYCIMEKAFNADGEEYSERMVKYEDRGISGGNYNLPYDIPVKMEFYIDNVRRRTPMLSFMQLGIRNVKVEVRDLPVQW